MSGQVWDHLHHAKMYVEEVYADILFEMFYFSVTSASGDGVAVICCSNIEETSENFIKWWKKRKLPQMQANGYKLDTFFHDREEYNISGINFISYHDSNESFMFCDKETTLSFGDIAFVVTKDCPSGDDDFKIKKVEK